VLATTDPLIPNQMDPKSLAQYAPLVGTPRLVYHIICQAVPIYAHGCAIFMGGCSMNRSFY
jgi:hypothetical protein